MSDKEVEAMDQEIRQAYAVKGDSWSDLQHDHSQWCQAAAGPHLVKERVLKEVERSHIEIYDKCAHMPP